MEDIDGGLHPAVDGQSLDDDDDIYKYTGYHTCMCIHTLTHRLTHMNMYTYTDTQADTHVHVYIHLQIGW